MPDSAQQAFDNERRAKEELTKAGLTAFPGAPILPTPLVDPAQRNVLRAFMKQHDEVTEQRDELADRLRITQLMLIHCLKRMGGAITVPQGALNEIARKNYGVRVEKTEAGEGDNVPLRVSTFQNREAVSDIRPGT